jgi:glycosyltransferase involved in cell wall biosynthesis
VRVLIVTTAFPRSVDDKPAKWLAETVRRLSNEGYDIEVLTSAYRGGGNTSFHGVPVHRFRYFLRRWERLTHEEAAPDRMRRSALYKVAALSNVICGTVAAWRLGRWGRYDIIHIHWPVPHALFGWAAQMAAARRPKLVTHFYSIEVRWIRHSFPILTGFLRRAITSADRVVAISASTARAIQEIAPVRVDVIPYAVDQPNPLRLASAGRQPAIVLSAGRLVERKGIRYLIEAIAILPTAFHVSLVIIGDGPEGDALRTQVATLGIGDRVTFRDWVTPEALDQAYGDASVFILPAIVDSRGDTEGLGMVLLEAMSHRVPVITTPLGGITDIVADGETGLLVSPNDAQGLAAAIARILTDRDLATRLGRAGQEYAQQRFGWDTVLASWRALYADVLSRDTTRTSDGGVPLSRGIDPPMMAKLPTGPDRVHEGDTPPYGCTETTDDVRA